MTDKPYSTDLKDTEWELIKPCLNARKGGMVERDALRRIVDGCFYVLRGGIPWRMMPHDLPPWENVYYHLRKWRRGTWEWINQVLRERHRVAQGVIAHPGRPLGKHCSGWFFRGGPVRRFQVPDPSHRAFK